MVTEIRSDLFFPAFSRNGQSLSLAPSSLEGERIPFRPFQIVSLWDMVNFDAHHFMHAMLSLQHFQQKAEEIDFWKMSESDQAAFISWVENARFWCSMYGLDDQNSFSRLLGVLKGEYQVTTPIPTIILEVKNIISYQLTIHRFMYMPDAQAAYYDRQGLFGNEVDQSFPEAKLDITSSGNCIACGLYTASVFHLMRVAEFGLRRIAAKLKVKLTHKGKPITVEYAVWDQIITASNNKIISIRQKPVGKKREEQLVLYSDAAQHCLFMKDIWRNNISHTREPYNEPEALAVLERVKDFMKFLTVNVP